MFRSMDDLDEYTVNRKIDELYKSLKILNDKEKLGALERLDKCIEVSNNINNLTKGES